MRTQCQRNVFCVTFVIACDYYYSTLEVRMYDYDYDLLQVHVVIPLATCLRNGYAIPPGYAEFPVLKELWV